MGARRAGRASRRPGALHWLLSAALVVVVASCTSGGAPRDSPSRTIRPPTVSPSASAPVVTSVPAPASCLRWSCRLRQTVALPDQRAVRLWLGSDQQNYESRPVVELLDHGVSVQSWISPRGDGWNGSLRCLAGRSEPNCVMLDSLGMHAGVAELLLLQAGRLVHPAGAEAVTVAGEPHAADLDGDGYLDVIGTTNDYRPNFAQGHNYWQTFQSHAGRLVLTGCAPETRGSAPPAQLLHGACLT
jgi:hypothetical protein